MYIILLHRIRTRWYNTPQGAYAKRVANLMVIYPLIYVVCTLPLASARMVSMAGHTPSLSHFCVAGAMITSNGWLDVLLYTMTRRIMLFTDDPPEEGTGVETFTVPFFGETKRFGTTTVIEGGVNLSKTGKNSSLGTHSHTHSHSHSRTLSGFPGYRSRQGSREELWLEGQGIVKAETVVQVTHEPMEMDDIREIDDLAKNARAVTPKESFESQSMGSSKNETGMWQR
jgi:hypothetical protein